MAIGEGKHVFERSGLYRWADVGVSLAVTILATAICAVLVRHVATVNLVMVYLLAVTYVASRESRRAAVLASVLGVLGFDFFFVPPGGTLAVADVEYLFTMAVMLTVSLLISTLTIRLKEQSDARHREALRAELERTRSDLLSSVSHDLRTPLAAIEGSSSVLMEQPELTARDRELVRTIHDESLRMSRMIRDLLDMTRMQSHLDLDFDWHGLDELAANAILRTEHLFDRPATLVVEGADVVAWVDGLLIEQVLVNLLENAAKHAGARAHVTVTINGMADRFTIEVADDGPGLQPGSESRVFDRFHRGGSDGFGLGLAICRAAAEAHRGAVTAANRAAGASFVLTLPRSKEPPHV